MNVFALNIGTAKIQLGIGEVPDAAHTQIDQAVRQMGISEDDLDMLSDEMSSMFGQRDEDGVEDDENESQTATFPLLNQLFGGSNMPAKQEDPNPKQEGKEEESKKKKKIIL